MRPDLRRRVLELYAAVDRAVAAHGPVCLASGRCCHFRDYDHVLYLTSLEAEVLLEGAPPPGQAPEPGRCPYQQGRLCTAREVRPLGCRIYHCDPAFQESAGRITESALAELKQLARDAGLDYRYAPLSHFLAGAAPRESIGRAD